MSMNHSPQWERLKSAAHDFLPPTTDDAATRGTLEGYFRAIEARLEHAELDEALRMSAALPKICSALEHPRCMSSTAHCICWCDAWVADCEDGENVYPLTRVYLRDEQETLRQWIGMDENFLRSVTQTLLRASRAWYLKRGAYDLTVQQNLGKVHADLRHIAVPPR
jgi:hypothetical protein